MDWKKENLTRRQFLKRNVFLVAILAFFGPQLKAFGQMLRPGRKEINPNVSDKEAMFYTKRPG